MGKRAREIRSAIKGVARSCGYKETELGELKPIVSKAEARRRFLTWKWAVSSMVITPWRELVTLYVDHKQTFQNEIVSALTGRIQEEMDAEILGYLTEAQYV